VSDALPFSTRLWFSFACFFRVLFDGRFGKAVAALDALDAPAAPVLPAAPAPVSPSPAAPAQPAGPDRALQLLALFQREGRLVDFLEQDVVGFPDADVGAAARVVHEGCRRALRAHAKVAVVRTEDEGARVVVEVGVPAEEVKLTGKVQGKAPYTGTLRHRGWRVTSFELPVAVRATDDRILAPAEVEL
jgi:hypothetical protein